VAWAIRTGGYGDIGEDKLEKVCGSAEFNASNGAWAEVVGGEGLELSSPFGVDKESESADGRL